MIFLLRNQSSKCFSFAARTVFFPSFLLFLFLISAGSFSFAEKAGEQSDAQSLTAEAFIASEAGRLVQAGENERALNALDALLREYPQDPLLKRYRAMVLDRLGRSDEAISVFKDLLSENPTHIPTHYFLGQAYARSGRSEDALKEWRWIAKQNEGTVYELWARSALQRSGASVASQAAQKVKRWGITGRYGYEYDSNVILRPDDKSLADPDDPNAGRQVMDLGLLYRAYSRRDVAVDMLYATRQTVHDDSLNEYNFHSEEFGTNLRKRLRIGSRDVVAGLRYECLLGFLEDDLFSVRNRWHLSGDTSFTPRTRTVIYDRITASNYGPDGDDPARTSRDGFYQDVGITQYWYSADFRRYVYGREEFNCANARGRNFDLIGSSSRVGVHTPVIARLDLDVSSGLELGFYPRYDSISTRDLSRRRDINWDLYAALTFYLTPRIGLRGFYRYINASNQNNFYDYGRQIGGVQVVYSEML